MRVWWVKVIWPIVQPPTGHHVRKLLSMIFLVMALARFGVFSYGSGGQFIKPELYGALLLLASLWLILTTNNRRGSLEGRAGATFGAALCAGMATDLILHAGSMTSALNLILFAWCLLGAAGDNHDHD